MSDSGRCGLPLNGVERWAACLHENRGYGVFPIELWSIGVIFAVWVGRGALRNGRAG